MLVRNGTPPPANYSSVTLSVTQGDACTPSVRTYLGPKPVRITRVTEENAPRFKDSTSQSAFVCPVVSRRHALVTFSDTGAVYLTDTNSHHGTTIARTSDSRSMPATTVPTATTNMSVEPGARTKLEHGDVVTFGKTVVKDNIPHEPVVVRISINPGTPPTESVKISPGRYGLFDSDDSSSESVSEDEHESDPDHEDEHEYDEDDSEVDGEDDCCEFAGEKPVVFCVDSDAASECDYGDASPSYYAVSGSPQQQAPSLPRFADFFGPSPSASGAHASTADRLSNESVQLTQAPPLPLLEPESESSMNPGFGQGSAEEKLYGSIGNKEPVPSMQSEAVQPRFPPPTTGDSGMILPPVPSALLPQPPIRAPLPLYFNPVHMPPMPPMPMPPPHFVPLLSYAPPSFAPFEPIHNFDALPVPMPVTQGFKPMNMPCGPPPGARYECGLQLRDGPGPSTGFNVPPSLPPVLNNTSPESIRCGVQPPVVIDVDAFKPNADDVDSGSDMDVGSDSEDDSDSESNSDSNDDDDEQSGIGGGQDPMGWASLRQTYGVSVEREESDSDAEGEEEEICVVSAPAPSPVVSIPVTPAIVPVLAPAPGPELIPESAPEPAPAPSVPEVAPILIFEAAPAPVAPPVLPAPKLPPVHDLPEPVAEVQPSVDVQALEDELARSRNEVQALREALNAVQEQVRTLTAAPPSPVVTMAPSTPPRKRTLADLEADDIDAAPAPAPSLPPPRVKRRRIGLVASAAAGAVATYVGLAFF